MYHKWLTFNGDCPIGAWVAEPTKFSNEYAADMLEDPWQLVGHGDTWGAIQ